MYSGRGDGSVRTVSLVGSTGSIGTQALEVVRAEPERYRVTAIAARSSMETLAAQAIEFRPDVVVLVDEADARELEARLPAGTELRTGTEALASIATDA